MTNLSAESGGVSAAVRPRSGVPRTDTRSAVTNGNRFHVEAVGDSAWSRRQRDIYENLLAQFDCAAESDLQLARRAAGLAAQLEQGEARIARGEPVDSSAHATLINAQRRILADLAASLRARRRGRAA